MLVEVPTGGKVHVDLSKVISAWETGNDYIIKFGKNDTLRVTEGSFKKVVEWIDWPDSPSEHIMVEVVDNSELCEQLRNVYCLSSFAQIFGFDLTSEEDWTWHDVAVAMARRIEQGPEAGGDEHERDL